MAKTTKIALAGEGGQGVQSIAQILAEAANSEGKEVLYIPNFGVEQRGGVSVAFVQVGEKRIGAPKFQIGDIVIALSDRAVHRTLQYVGPETTFVYDKSIDNVEDVLPKNAARILAIPALDIAKNELHPRVFNIIIMGAVVQATGIVDIDKAKDAVEQRFGYVFEKNPKLRELNFTAIERGMQLIADAM